MTILQALLLAVIGVLLAVGAAGDLRRRSLPLILPLATLAAAAATLGASLPAETAPGVATGAAIASGLGLAGVVLGVIGVADGLMGVALILVVLSFEPARQVDAAAWGSLGTAAAAGLWVGSRITRSLRISGLPRNGWDLLALTRGRAGGEPQVGEIESAGRRESRLEGHIEAFRTPDGLRLARDPCPLVSCFLVGYFAMVGSLL